MTPKHYFSAIALSLFALTTAAQSPLSFTPSEWDFGTIRESDGPVSHTFTGTNTTGKPVVILDIFTSCGCTTPEFTKKPILPGEKTAIKVTYDPANRPGAFSKDLLVFDSEQRRAGKLTIRGSVTARERTTEERYPVNAGKGVRLSETLCAFSFLYHGRPAMTAIGIANTSDIPVHLELHSDQNNGLLLLNYPRELAAGAKGEIRIGYNIPAESPHYGTVMDVLSLRIDGKETPVRIMAHGIAVDNPELSNEIYRSKAEIDKYILKFGALKRGKGLQKLPLTISNTGDGALTIRAVEVDKGIGCTLRSGRRIEQGRSITAYVTIDPAKQEYGPLTGYLTVITDDPERPMRKVRVTAIIEE